MILPISPMRMREPPKMCHQGTIVRQAFFFVSGVDSAPKLSTPTMTIAMAMMPIRQPVKT